MDCQPNNFPWTTDIKYKIMKNTFKEIKELGDDYTRSLKIVST